MPLPILLVEDDLSFAQAMLAALEETGLPVEHCPTGELAIELVQTKRYAVIIVELALSVSEGVSGTYVVKALRKMPKEQRPAVVMLAAESASLRGIDRSSVAAMLFKPIDFSLFAEYVTATYRRAITSFLPGEPKESARRAHSYCGACDAAIVAWDPENPRAFDIWIDVPCAGCGMTPRLAGGRSDWEMVPR